MLQNIQSDLFSQNAVNLFSQNAVNQALLHVFKTSTSSTVHKTGFECLVYYSEQVLSWCFKFTASLPQNVTANSKV